MYERLIAESRGVTPSPCERATCTPSLYIFSRAKT
nr:MAG TPA: hypothetical protein [Caudoviricetes sp.]